MHLQRSLQYFYSKHTHILKLMQDLPQIEEKEYVAKVSEEVRKSRKPGDCNGSDFEAARICFEQGFPHNQGKNHISKANLFCIIAILKPSTDIY